MKKTWIIFLTILHKAEIYPLGQDYDILIDWENKISRRYLTTKIVNFLWLALRYRGKLFAAKNVHKFHQKSSQAFHT